MRLTTKRRAGAVVVAMLAVGATACGSDGDEVSDLIDDAEQQLEDVAEQADEELEEFADEIGDAIGAGGGGTLIFDGEEIPIASATCLLDDETFDVGTVSDNGFRVFISKTNPANDASVQILDADSIQWFPRDVTGDEAERDASTFTAGPYTFFNNQSDVTVEAQVTVECP